MNKLCGTQAFYNLTHCHSLQKRSRPRAPLKASTEISRCEGGVYACLSKRERFGRIWEEKGGNVKVLVAVWVQSKKNRFENFEKQKYLGVWIGITYLILKGTGHSSPLMYKGFSFDRLHLISSFCSSFGVPVTLCLAQQVVLERLVGTAFFLGETWVAFLRRGGVVFSHGF